MREFHGTATGRVDATPTAVFDVITDVGRLPEWNDAIESVTEQPAELTVGAEWVVVMHPARMPRWKSRSRVVEIDQDGLRFAYRTSNEDGNPSWALWRWHITPAAGAAQVTVEWEVHLETLDRRWLAGPLRSRQLRKEVAASLPRIEQAARTA
jgi:uncharacterized protein YndB with AHSA1/START domain